MAESKDVTRVKLKEKIRTTAYTAIIAAAVTVILLIGGIFDIVDLACVSVSALVIHLAYGEFGGKYAFLIYAVAALLSFLLMPMRSASLYFTAFFGYYPLLRAFTAKHVRRKGLYYAILFLVYNAAMTALYILFKSVFGVEGEPPAMLLALLISSNVFFACLELLTGRIQILYDYKIKKILQKHDKHIK